MSITINGSANTITGLSAGGLPSGIITNSNLNGQDVTPAALNSGQIIQMVNTTLTSTTSVSSGSNGTQSIPGLSLSITPQFSTSRILLTAHIMFGFASTYGSTGNTPGGFITRNSTSINLGGSNGSAQTVSMGLGGMADANQTWTYIYSYIDSPSTTSAITYQFCMLSDQTLTFYINRSSNDLANATGKRGVSTLTAWEIR
jgi:hypothetical protein